MAKPSSFKITVYPAVTISPGCVRIDFMECIYRTTATETLESIRSCMQHVGQQVGNDLGQGEVHVSIDPIGRAPNGYRQFEESNLDEMTVKVESMQPSYFPEPTAQQLHHAELDEENRAAPVEDEDTALSFDVERS